MYHKKRHYQGDAKYNNSKKDTNKLVVGEIDSLSEKPQKTPPSLTPLALTARWYSWLWQTTVTVAFVLLGGGGLVVVDAALFLPTLHQRSIKTASLLMATTTTSAAATSSGSSSGSSSSSSTTRPTTSRLENWRVFPKDACDTSKNAASAETTTARRILQQRATWSTSCFQQALALHDQFATCPDSYISPQIQKALQTLHDAYRLYGPDNVVCSFNGGKDACVILELVRAVHAKYYQAQLEKKQQDDNAKSSTSAVSSSSSAATAATAIRMHRPRAVYWDREADEFEQVSDFVRQRALEYDLDLIVFEKGIHFSQGLQILVDHNQPVLEHLLNDNDENEISSELWSKLKLPSLPMAFVLGTRSGNPNSLGQDTFCPSSSSYMPSFMRCNPILHWTYGHVWQFLRAHSLPTCCLYEQGYTSLGSVHDTIRNPALYVPPPTTTATATASEADEDNSNTDNNANNGTLVEGGKYRPAWMLTDYTMERAGRIAKTPSEKKSGGGGGGATTNKKKETTASTTTSSSAAAATFSRANSSLTNLSTMSGAVVVLPSGVPGVVATRDAAVEAADTAVGAQDSSDIVSFCSDTETQRTVGLLIIGDEILKGYTVDTNSQAAATALRDQNVLLKRVVVVSDDLQEIADEILRLQQDVDVIITSGGVGPTHDDVTIKSVAAALDLEMQLHQEMAELLLEKMRSSSKTERIDSNITISATTVVRDDEHNGDYEDDGNHVLSQLTQAQIKMATLPSKSKLRYLSKTPGDWPVLQCGNIFVLPGVPEYFAQKIVNVAAYLCCQWERSVQYKVVLSVEENSIVSTLNQIVQQHPNVTFGSYPFVDHPDRKTVITVEGKLLTHQELGQEEDQQQQQTLTSARNSVVFDPSQIDTSKVVMDRHVQLALDDLLAALPAGSVLRVDNDMRLFS